MNSIRIPRIITAVLLAATCSISAMAQTRHNINTDGNITISSGGAYIIEGTGSATTNRIKVNPGITADITLNNVNINVSNACAFDMGGATVSLTLEGDNALTSGGFNAGIYNSDGNLTISGSGTLEVHGGNGNTNGSGAGIGGNGADCKDCGVGYGGKLTVNSGSVTAYGGNGNNNSSGGAGIGGGGCGNCNSGTWCAGIYGGGSNLVTVNGGIVKAFGGKGSNNSGGAAGIGGGGGGWKGHGGSGRLTVNGGSITATGGSSDQRSGGGHGAGIGGGGGGASNSGGTGNCGISIVIINGGTITATATGTACGIGTGGYAVDERGGHGNMLNSTITINGGSIKASSISDQPVSDAGAVYLNILTIGNTPVADGTPVTAGSIGGIPCDEIPDASSGKYGIKDVKTDASGNVYFYLPAASEEWLILKANDREYGINCARSSSNSNNAKTLLLPYDITLSETGTRTFSADYGYDEQTAFTVTVTNEGYNPTDALDIALSGAQSTDFTLSTLSITDIAVDGTADFTVTPKAGIASGTTSEATVTVSKSSDSDIKASFTVSFTANKKTITVSGGAIAPKTYDGTTDVDVMGITFSGLKPGDDLDIGDDYTVSNAAFTDPSAGTGNRTVQMDVTLSTDPSSPARNYTLSDGTGWQLTGQSIGKADLTVNHLDYTPPAGVSYNGAPHGIAATPTLKPEYDGMGTTPKVFYTSTDGGISYGKSGNAPVDAGEYNVTLDVNEGDNFTLTTDLLLGAFTIGKITLTANHLDCDLTSATYDGAPHGIAAPPTLKPPHTGMGTVRTVYYTGTNGTDYPKSATAPVNAGDYTVTADISEGAIFSAATDLLLGTFTIGKIALTANHLDCDLTSAAYDGAPHGIAAPPTLKPEYDGMGTVLAVYYTGTNDTDYPKSETAPVDVGEYNVTLDVNEGDNFTLTTDLLLGAFTIGKITLTANHLDCALTNATYDGARHGIAAPPTLKPPHTGMGTVRAVYYTGTNGTDYPKSETAPVNAGEYTVTADISEGAIFSAATGLTLGSFTIDKATPTLAVLDFTLGDIVCTGTPYPVPVIPAEDIIGLGEITIYYNGSTTVPVDPGEYTVTIDIAAGDNYAAVTALPLGAFTIQEPQIPVPTHFRVLLPSAAGLTTDPPAGTYNVNRGSNFTFTLTPDVPSEDGSLPQVQTNRPIPNVPNASGIRITPNENGSYTVVIIGIRQDIEITLAVAGSKSDPTDNESVAAGLEVYTAPGAIVIANSRPDAATLRVYTLAGTLVRLTTVPPGTTRLSVPAGIYIVTDGGAFHRKTVVLR